MENYDAEGMMQQNALIVSDTMGQMEQDAAEDFERSFEPAEAPSAPAYQPQQQPYAGDYDDYLEDQAQATLVPQQMPQPVPFRDLSQMASAIADSIVTDDGANYVGPALYNAFSKYTEASEMYDGAEKEAAVKAANREITKKLTEMGSCSSRTSCRRRFRRWRLTPTNRT